ncbi:MAG: hypothetical protein WCD02_10500 [Terriglobales bacterium]
MQMITDGGRLLNRTEALLCDFMGEGREREAVSLAPFVFLREGCTEQEVEDAVTLAFVAVLEEVHGQHAVLECVGQRRDQLRDNNVARMR